MPTAYFLPIVNIIASFITFVLFILLLLHYIKTYSNNKFYPGIDEVFLFLVVYVFLQLYESGYDWKKQKQKQNIALTFPLIVATLSAFLYEKITSALTDEKDLWGVFFKILSF